MGNKILVLVGWETKKKRKERMCVIVPPIAVSWRKEKQKKKCSSFGSSLAENFKEEGRRKIEEVRPCM